jgi:hypothetical protein
VHDDVGQRMVTGFSVRHILILSEVFTPRCTRGRRVWRRPPHCQGALRDDGWAARLLPGPT